MAASVYLETSFLSYLTARPSRDVVVAGRQEITRHWWRTSRRDYDLYSSEVILAEASVGSPAAARLRLDSIRELPLLQVTPEARSLARCLVAAMRLPPKAELDALPIALAAVHEMDLLITWNCAHLANALMRLPLTAACEARGYRLPIICTPDQLMAGGTS